MAIKLQITNVVQGGPSISHYPKEKRASIVFNYFNNKEIERYAIMKLGTIQTSDIAKSTARKDIPLDEEKLHPLKLVIIGKRFHQGEIFGGAERFIFRLAQQLAKKGAEIIVLGGKMRKSWESTEVLDVPHGSILVKRLPHPRIRLFGTLIYNLSLFAQLLRLKKSDVVIHVNFASKELMTAAIAKAFTKKPLVCRIACAGKTGEIYLETRRFYAPLFRSMLSRVDAFVALSDEIAEELLTEGIPMESIVKIPNGVDIEEFKPPDNAEKLEARKKLGLSPDEVVVGYIGRLSKQKGLELLIKAVKKCHSHTKTLVAGKGPEEMRLKALTEALGLEDSIRFLGAVDNVKSVYQACDIFVLPSLFEGLSNSLLEAMAMGLACIATDVSGSNEVIVHGESGLIVPTGSTAHLAEAIDKLVGDEKMRKRLGASARKRAEEMYSLESTAGSYSNLYQRLLTKKI